MAIHTMELYSTFKNYAIDEYSQTWKDGHRELLEKLLYYEAILTNKHTDKGTDGQMSNVDTS